MGIKGKSETELCICIVSLAAFGGVLSCGYETVPCIYSCRIWFANLHARVAGQCLLLQLGTPSFPLLCSCWEPCQSMPLSEKGCRHWSDNMWSRSSNGDNLIQRAGKLCHSALWQGALHFPFFKNLIWWKCLYMTLLNLLVLFSCVCISQSGIDILWYFSFKEKIWCLF